MRTHPLNFSTFESALAHLDPFLQILIDKVLSDIMEAMNNYNVLLKVDFACSAHMTEV